MAIREMGSAVGSGSNQLQLFKTLKENEHQLTAALRGAGDSGSAFAGLAMNVESFSGVSKRIGEDRIDAAQAALDGAIEKLQDNIRSLSGNATFEFNKAQRMAAEQAGMLAADPRTVLARSISRPDVKGIMEPAVGDVAEKRLLSAEAYDERVNNSAILYSMQYNAQAALQEEATETWWPTITVPNDNAAFTIEVKRWFVYDAIERQANGEVADFKRINLVRAARNPNLLNTNDTTGYPVFRNSAADQFWDKVVAGNVVTQTIKPDRNRTVVTAPLRPGVTRDILGLSQTDEMLNAGPMNHTDSLDTKFTLRNIYVEFTDPTDPTVKETFKFNTSVIPSSEYTYVLQGGYREMQLNFRTSDLMLDKNSKTHDGAVPVLLAGLSAQDLMFRLETRASGNVDIQDGKEVLDPSASGVKPVSCWNVSKQELPLNAAPAATLAAILATGKIIGYDLTYYLANSNRRLFGQLMDTRSERQMYYIPLRSPVSIQHPAHVDPSVDAIDIQALLTHTRFRLVNEGIRKIHEHYGHLTQFASVNDGSIDPPNVLGVGRFYVKPVRKYLPLDVTATVMNLTSEDARANIQAVIVNHIRQMGIEMFIECEYAPANSAMHGGVAPMPELIVLCSPDLEAYITVPGELRTMGGSPIPIRVVSHIDQTLSGRIYMTFGQFGANRNTEVVPLNSGNLFWSSELVLSGTINRQGATSRETMVQPRYFFLPHLPVMGLIEVTGIPGALARTPIDFHNV